ncbi:MAG: YkgJ family cysteine cluster protein [Planctomycetales bacterium]
MSPSESLCARCARHQRTCCQDTEIYVTPGDVRRIAAETGRSDFVEFRPPRDPVYAAVDDDPSWQATVFRPDGTRRVLVQRGDGDCGFLGPQGCTLSASARPLVCRLYPFDYTAASIRPQPANGCPRELLAPGDDLLQVLDMLFADAVRWHGQLYAEIAEDRPAPPPLVACEVLSVDQAP